MRSTTSTVFANAIRSQTEISIECSHSQEESISPVEIVKSCTVVVCGQGGGISYGRICQKTGLLQMCKLHRCRNLHYFEFQEVIIKIAYSNASVSTFNSQSTSEHKSCSQSHILL